jgi:hypothetical protein
MIERMEIFINYEYHASTADSPAVLEFLIFNKSGVKIWSSTWQVRKIGSGEEKIEFKISKTVDEEITVEIVPKKSGDFGFYINSIFGKVFFK